jgi:hypothetical protein
MPTEKDPTQELQAGARQHPEGARPRLQRRALTRANGWPQPRHRWIRAQTAARRWHPRRRTRTRPPVQVVAVDDEMTDAAAVASHERSFLIRATTT